MASSMSEEEIYEEAKKRVKAKREFFSHLTAYIAVNILLIIIWALTGAGFPWFLFPAGGWGIGIVFHFVSAYGHGRLSVEKEYQRLKEKERKKRSS